MEDQIIIKYIKNKKEEGLKMLIDTHGDYVHTIVRNNLSSLLNYQDECINDIFLAIWMNIKNFDPKKNTLKNWIGVIAKYKTIDYKRKYLKDICIDNLDEDIKTIDKNLLSIEIKEEVNSLLNNLNTYDKEIFTKRYLEDLDIETIASQLNTQTTNIYTRISRCKKKLRSLASKY